MALFVGIEPGERRSVGFDRAPREVKMEVDVLGAASILQGEHIVLGPKSLVLWRFGHFGTFHGVYSAEEVRDHGYQAVPLHIGTDVPGRIAFGHDRAWCALALVLTLDPDQPVGFLTTTLPWGGDWRFRVYRMGPAGTPELGYDGLAFEYLRAPAA